MQDEWEFEWESAKAESNRHKHGVSFEAARSMWDDPFMRDAPIFGSAEGRRLAVARVGMGEYWTAIYVYRGERIRLISVRRSSKREVDFYEGD